METTTVVALGAPDVSIGRGGDEDCCCKAEICSSVGIPIADNKESDAEPLPS